MKVNTILQGDCKEVLKSLPEESIDCVVTSPPYYGLRDYGVDGQIGLEETPEQYVDKLVEVFREVKRVLKKDGTIWVNLGDSYAGGAGRWGGNNNVSDKQTSSQGSLTQIQIAKKWNHESIKQKDLIGIPWLFAFALRNDGWYLRQDIIWHKPNPMPESVKDRCTKSHEYIFLLSKSQKYYFDNEAIKEDCVSKDTHKSHLYNLELGASERNRKVAKEYNDKRNKRDVWTINVKPCKEAHFATYPEELIKPCILAGCREEGMQSVLF